MPHKCVLWYLAQMIGTFGDPPPELLAWANTAHMYFNDDGKFPALVLVGAFGSDRCRCRQNNVLFSCPLLPYLLTKPVVFLITVGGFMWNHVVPGRSLRARGQALKCEDRILFLAFVRRVLQWNPVDRPSASELLDDPWLKSSAEVQPAA